MPKIKYKTITMNTKYWKPGEDYLIHTLKFVGKHAKDNDFLVISEKAISIALGRIIDEAKILPGLSARLLASLWMRRIWGYLLGPLARINQTNLERLRNYPIKEGANHKQTILSYSGPIYALKNFSEGGIDGSNLPYEYVSLPLEDPKIIAKEIHFFIKEKIGINIIVIILDSDKSFSLKDLHLTSRPTTLKKILNIGPFAYLFGRFLKLRARSTPIATSSENLSPEISLRIAAIANKAIKSGAGRTVWDMSRYFNVGITEVSWKMLESLTHRPVVIVRRLKA
ncbi:coenzyme F420-0:L-glutamate ligase [[Eubacterium] cellulosolvens]